MSTDRARPAALAAALVATTLLPVAASGAQPPTCFGEVATIVAQPGIPTVGTDGDDVIVGTSGSDDIRGGAGDDTICGLAGADVIRGNHGRDRINAGGGHDTVTGGRGRDVIVGSSGDDELSGNSGGDAISGNKGGDHIRGGAGADTIGGGPGADTIEGNGGDDTISGNDGRDDVRGGTGDDTISGGPKADTIEGNGGHDTVRGGSGPDVIDGGPRGDTLEGRSGADVVAGGGGHDTIGGGRGADRLDGGPGSDQLDGGRGPDTCLSGQGVTEDVDCLEGLRLALVADLGDRAGIVVSPPGDDRLFVIEQYHGIRVIEDGELLDTPFLDLEDEVATGNEQGVLGLAFHPDYAENRRFYVNYIARGGDTKVKEYRARRSDPDRASKSSGRLILDIDQPHRWHNGGMLAFGPDGYLYISTGDGGPADDPNGHGQDTDSLLAALLRIDVDGDRPYEIPADNPFVGREGADEIWAYGLRNPWRFSFDAESERLYIGDVGQYNWEEVNVAPAGRGGINYGWSVVEGPVCYRPSRGCDRSGIRPAKLDIPHTTGACSVIGGYVYRGQAIPELDGHYFHTDFCTQAVDTFLLDRGAATQRTRWLTVSAGRGVPRAVHDPGPNSLPPGSPTSFGLDADGELYISTFGGQVYRVEPVR